MCISYWSSDVCSSDLTRPARRTNLADAELGTDITREILVGDHNARFDQHLSDRNVEPRHELTNLLDLLARLQHQQCVGALIDRHAAALAQHRGLVRAEQRLEDRKSTRLNSSH